MRGDRRVWTPVVYGWLWWTTFALARRAGRSNVDAWKAAQAATRKLFRDP